jgi:hypothetical protein
MFVAGVVLGDAAHDLRIHIGEIRQLGLVRLLEDPGRNAAGQVDTSGLLVPRASSGGSFGVARLAHDPRRNKHPDIRGQSDVFWRAPEY